MGNRARWVRCGLALALLASSCTSQRQADPRRTSGTPGTSSPSPTVASSPTPRATSPSPEQTSGLDGQTARWTQLPDAPTARLEVAAAGLSDGVYVAGGLIRGGVTRRVEVYRPDQMRWSRGPDLPFPLHHASAVAWEGGMLVVGGFRPGGGLFGNASDAVLALTCRADFTCPPGAKLDRWLRLATLPHPRGAAAAGVIGQSLIVAGGQSDGRLVAETDIFDLRTRRWRRGAPIPTPRDHLAAAAEPVHEGEASGFLWTVGGRRLSIDSVVGAFERYDVERDRWEQLPDLPTPRGGLGAAIVRASVVVLGGEGPAGTYPQVEAFDVERRRWFRLPDMPEARHGIGVATFDFEVTHLLVAVGGPQAGGSYSRRTDAIRFGTYAG